MVFSKSERSYERVVGREREGYRCLLVLIRLKSWEIGLGTRANEFFVYLFMVAVTIVLSKYVIIVIR